MHPVLTEKSFNVDVLIVLLLRRFLSLLECPQHYGIGQRS